MSIFVGNLDFSGKEVLVTFEADDTNIRPRYDSIAHINVTDDNINEADQVFILRLELEHSSVKGDVLLQLRPSSLCKIIDDDRM